MSGQSQKGHKRMRCVPNVRVDNISAYFTKASLHMHMQRFRPQSCVTTLDGSCSFICASKGNCSHFLSGRSPVMDASNGRMQQAKLSKWQDSCHVGTFLSTASSPIYHGPPDLARLSLSPPRTKHVDGRKMTCPRGNTTTTVLSRQSSPNGLKVVLAIAIRLGRMKGVCALKCDALSEHEA